MASFAVATLGFHASEVLGNEEEAVKNQLLNDTIAPAAPAYLYHYTNAEGLLGIVEKREIWATHTQYLNDLREFVHALQLIREEIKSRTRNASNPAVKRALEEMAVAVESRRETVNVCVCSFSEDHDSLPQWRQYAGSSSGYALGFTGKRLTAVAASEKCFLVRCVYDTAKQCEIVSALVQEVLDENLERDRVGVKNEELPRAGNLGAYLHRFAPILKDRAFSTEREWRLITMPQSCASERFAFRAGQSMLLPYYRLPLSFDALPLVVDQVVVGPTPHPLQARKSTEDFLLRHAVKEGDRGQEIEIKATDIPYRSW